MADPAQQPRTEAAGGFVRGEGIIPALLQQHGDHVLPTARLQALAETAEFLRPASYYRAKPHKAAGDVARLQEWLAGQGVEVTE